MEKFTARHSKKGKPVFDPTNSTDVSALATADGNGNSTPSWLNTILNTGLTAAANALKPAATKPAAAAASTTNKLLVYGGIAAAVVLVLVLVLSRRR